MVLGMDLIFDNDYKPYLIEMNYKPVFRNKKYYKEFLHQLLVDAIEPLLVDVKTLGNDKWIIVRQETIFN